jgi:nitrous oxide reductase accessory protein NosL
MRYSRIIMAQVLFFAVVMMSAAFAADVPCSQCGMIVDAGSKFVAKIVAGDSTLFFCDIGDLFVYLKRKKMSADGAFVKDHPSGEWVEAKAAYFVHDEKRFKTPMGWGVAAYRDRNRAAEAGKAMDFDAAAKAMQ